MTPRPIRIGDRIRDRITGLEGIAVGMTEYINGCRQWCVQPEKLDKDGKVADAPWIDEAKLERAVRYCESHHNATDRTSAEPACAKCGEPENSIRHQSITFAIAREVKAHAYEKASSTQQADGWADRMEQRMADSVNRTTEKPPVAEELSAPDRTYRDQLVARNAELEARAEDYPALFDRWSAAEAELRELVASMPPAPNTYEVLADLHEQESGHKCSYSCDSPYAVNCNCAGKCRHHPKAKK